MKYKRGLLSIMVFTAVVLLSSGSPAHAAVEPIVMDGQFTDWDGGINLPDPAGDSADENGDIINFYWGNNRDDATLYWMIERNPSSSWVCYIVFIDTNNNDEFRDDVDRLVMVIYQPLPNGSRVKVTVRNAATGALICNSRTNDWGESIGEGGSKAEFSASFADMGMSVGQTVRMYVTSYTIIHLLKQAVNDIEAIFDAQGPGEEHGFHPPLPADRAPDTGNVQWSPVPILGYWAMGAIVLGGGAIWYFNERRRCSSRR